MALALHHLQSYYMVEISLGQHNMGNHHLHSQFSPLAEVTPLPKSVLSPEDIVDRIKGKLADSMQSVPDPSETNPSTVSASKSAPRELSQLERARQIIEQNRLSVDTKLHTFTVLGSERPHVVTLFPKQTCSCPSTSTCYHILAAQMSIGLEKQQPQHTMSHTQLRKNARSRSEKKSGRKQPRPGDCEILPAPDAPGTKKTQPGGNYM